MDETGLSARAKQRYYQLTTGHVLFSLKIIYILYTPRTQNWKLPFSIGKGSRAALEGAAREQGGAVGEQWGSTEGARGSTNGQSRGAAHWSLNWLPCTRLQLLALFMTFVSPAAWLSLLLPRSRGSVDDGRLSAAVRPVLSDEFWSCRWRCVRDADLLQKKSADNSKAISESLSSKDVEQRYEARRILVSNPEYLKQRHDIDLFIYMRKSYSSVGG